MFKPARMKKVKLQLPVEQEGRFLEEVSRLEILQVKNVKKGHSEPDSGIKIIEERNSILSLAKRCDSILNRLPKEGIITQLIGKNGEALKLSKEQELEMYSSAQRILSGAENKLDKWERLRRLKLSTRKQVSSKISFLLKSSLIVLKKIERTDNIIVLEGWVKKENRDMLIETASKTMKNNYLVYFEETKSLGKNILTVRLATLAQYHAVLEESLGSLGVARLIAEDGKEEGLRTGDLEEDIDIDSVKKKMMLLKKTLVNRLEILKAEENIVRLESSIYLEGWVRSRDVEKLTSLLKQGGYDYKLSVEDPEKWEEAPIALENPPVIRSFEIITSMFGTPGYGQIDPTPLLAVTYTFFFGLMFADVFDGLLLLAFSLLLYRGLGSRSLNGRRLSEILMLVSLSSISFGFLTGEFMGGVVNIPVLWFNGFEDPMYFLLLAIVIGIVQITIGFIIGFINELLARRFKNALGEKASWLLLLYGSIIILLYYFYHFESSPHLYLGSILVASGLILMVISNPRNLMEITRIISNIVSYSRIVAINISHVGISRAFALLATQLINSGNIVIGVLIGGMLLLIAHVFIVFIESFIAFAHSLRLHFVEFFSKFFEPTGNVFKPLSLAIENVEG
ncbi:MAG: V-type ATP synthase subunit I [Thermoproteota archaeon]